jgi:cell wall-associated NlpC family hydrolase
VVRFAHRAIPVAGVCALCVAADAAAAAPSAAPVLALVAPSSSAYGKAKSKSGKSAKASKSAKAGKAAKASARPERTATRGKGGTAARSTKAAAGNRARLGARGSRRAREAERAAEREAQRAAEREAQRRAERAVERAAAERVLATAPVRLEVPVVEVAAPGLAQSAAASWEAALAFGAPPAAGRAATVGPLAALSRSATSLLDGLVTRARSQLGTRYVYGAAAPGSQLDCSSFVRYVMEALDVRLPRTANQQARVGRPVPRDPSQLRPGDLLTFGSGRHTSHVGIYLGSGRFIHASVKSGRVIETTFDRNTALFRRWQGARRLLAGADTVAGDEASGG